MSHVMVKRKCCACLKPFMTTSSRPAHNCRQCREKARSRARRKSYDSKYSSAAHQREIEQKAAARKENRVLDVLEHNRSMVVSLLKGGFFR